MADAGIEKALKRIGDELHDLNTTLRRRTVKIETVEEKANDKNVETTESNAADDQ